MLVIDGTFGQMIRNNIHHLNNERIFNLLTNNGLYKLSINTLDSRLLSVLGIEQNILPLVNRAPGYFITLVHDSRPMACAMSVSVLSVPSCRTATLDIFFSIWLNLKSQCFCALS